MHRPRTMPNCGLALVALGLAATLAATLAAAQESEFRSPGEFNSIQVTGDIEVEIRQGDDFTVEVIGPPDVAGSIVTEVMNSTLAIHQRPGTPAGGFFGFFEPDLEVVGTLPELVAVSATSGADIVSTGRVASEALSIVASGGSDIHMHLDVTSLEVNSTGGSDVELAGSVESASLRSSGGSDVNAMELWARSVDVQASGGSDTILSVEDRLVGRAAGGSDVVYLGDPEFVDIEASGGSDVTRL